MSLDIGAAILAVVLTGLGYYSGALKQLTRVGAALLAFFSAPLVAAVLRDILQEQVAGRDGFAMSHISQWPLLLVAGALIYGVVSLLSLLAIRLMRASSDDLTSADRTMGGGLGFTKALLVIYMVASVLLLFEPNLERGDPGDELCLRDSYVTRAVAAYPAGWEWVASTMRFDDHDGAADPHGRAVPGG